MATVPARRCSPTGHDSDSLRDSLAARGVIANIRLMPTRKRFPAFPDRVDLPNPDSPKMQKTVPT